MKFNLVAWALMLPLFGIPQGWAKNSYEGIWSRSTWWCASRISSDFHEKECSLTVSFNSEGECTWAELTYWWTGATGLLEPLHCVSEEDGVFKIYRETEPSEVVYEGHVVARRRNLLGHQVLVIETGNGRQGFVKGMP